MEVEGGRGTREEEGEKEGFSYITWTIIMQH